MKQPMRRADPLQLFRGRRRGLEVRSTHCLCVHRSQAWLSHLSDGSIPRAHSRPQGFRQGPRRRAASSQAGVQTPPIPPKAASASPWRHEPTRGLTVGRSVLTFRATYPGLDLGVSLRFPAAPSLGLFLHTRIFDVIKIGRTVPLCLMLSLHRVISSACLLAPNTSY